jgi:gas vesicle structural protein
MAAVAAPTPRGYLERPKPSGLADVIDVILDKGLVIDAFVRVSLIGIEILTIDARIVIASVDTYLRFASAVNRLDLGSSEGQGLPELMQDMTSGAAKSKTSGVLDAAKEKIFGDDDEDEGEDEDEEKQESRPRRRSSSGSSKSSGSSRSSGSSASSRSRSRRSSS